MKHKTKWIKGVLCKDKGSHIQFFPNTTKEQVHLKERGSFRDERGGYWVKIWKATPNPFMFTKIEWLKLYYAKDIPKKGKCIEIVLEM